MFVGFPMTFPVWIRDLARLAIAARAANDDALLRLVQDAIRRESTTELPPGQESKIVLMTTSEASAQIIRRTIDPSAEG